MEGNRVLCNNQLLKEVALELGLPLETVKQMTIAQSEYIKQVIESGTFDSIRLPYLGVFKSKPKEIQMINHLQGMTKEQQDEFKKAVRTGRIKLTTWEKKYEPRATVTQETNPTN